MKIKNQILKYFTFSIFICGIVVTNLASAKEQSKEDKDSIRLFDNPSNWEKVCNGDIKPDKTAGDVINEYLSKISQSGLYKITQKYQKYANNKPTTSAGPCLKLVAPLAVNKMTAKEKKLKEYFFDMRKNNLVASELISKIEDKKFVTDFVNSTTKKCQIPLEINGSKYCDMGDCAIASYAVNHLIKVSHTTEADDLNTTVLATMKTCKDNMSTNKKRTEDDLGNFSPTNSGGGTTPSTPGQAK